MSKRGKDYKAMLSSLRLPVTAKPLTEGKKRKRRYNPLADPIRLLMRQGEEAIEMVKVVYAGAMKEKPDDFILGLNTWKDANLPDEYIEDLIDRAVNGDRHADRALSLLACNRFLKDPSPLGVWLYSVFETRAMRRERGRRRDTWRDTVITTIIDRLLAEYPGLRPYRSEHERETEPPTSACAILHFGIKRAGEDLSESQVEKIYRMQHPAK